MTPLSTMRELDVSIRGLRLRVCAWGEGHGPAVVCCHGWLDQGAAFDAIAVQLVAKGFRVFAPDHRGHGHSEWTPPGTSYHFMEYVADLDGLIDVLGLEEPLLVGHSMGGTIASLFAGLRPQRVGGLVLLDGLGPPAVSDEDAAAQAIAFLDQCAHPRARRVLSSVEEGAKRIQGTNAGLDGEVARSLAARAMQRTAEGLVWRWDPMHRTRAAVAYDVERHRVILRRIECPTAIAFGMGGWYPRTNGLDARVGELSSLVAHELFPCGHDLHHAAVEGVVMLVDRVFTVGSGGRGTERGRDGTD